MLIKNFQAKTIQDALDMVRSEFGNDAVVLKTDVVRDGEIKMFCVTAARDHGSAPGRSSRRHNEEPATVTTRPSAQARMLSSNRELETAILDVILPDLLQGETRDYYLRLRAHDVNPELAREICRRWQSQDEPTLESLSGILTAVAPATCEWPAPGSNIVLVGPCGSGKSTLLTKIATQLIFQEQEKVELTTLDNFRPSADQEINSINEIVEMVGETRKEYRTRNPRYKLIDTPGLVTGDNEELAEVSGQIAEIQNKFVVATLPLSSSWRQLSRFLTFAEPLEIDAVVFTQLDASDCCGAILNYAAGDHPPVWGIADSRQPTDAIRDLNINTELEKLIGEIDE